MHFVWGAVTGFAVAAVLAFFLYRAVIVAKLKAAAAQVEQAAEAAAYNAQKAARNEVSHVGAAVSGFVGRAAADVERKL